MFKIKDLLLVAATITLTLAGTAALAQQSPPPTPAPTPWSINDDGEVNIMDGMSGRQNIVVTNDGTDDIWVHVYDKNNRFVKKKKITPENSWGTGVPSEGKVYISDRDQQGTSDKDEDEDGASGDWQIVTP